MACLVVYREFMHTIQDNTAFFASVPPWSRFLFEGMLCDADCSLLWCKGTWMGVRFGGGVSSVTSDSTSVSASYVSTSGEGSAGKLMEGGSEHCVCALTRSSDGPLAEGLMFLT